MPGPPVATTKLTPFFSPRDSPALVPASSSRPRTEHGSACTGAGRPMPATWAISSLRLDTVRSTTIMASRWNSGFAMWRCAFSTTRDSPETWVLMSCST